MNIFFFIVSILGMIVWIAILCLAIAGCVFPIAVQYAAYAATIGLMLQSAIMHYRHIQESRE